MHITQLPMIILDSLYYRLPLVTNGCQLNSAKLDIPLKIGHALIYEVILVFMVVSYPLLWWKLRARQKIRVGKANGRLVIVTERHGVVGALNGRGNAGTSPSAGHSKQTFVLLTLLTCSVLVCWTPTIVMFSLRNWFQADTTTVRKVTNVIFTMEPTIDPILFTLALGDLRSAVKDAAKKLVDASWNRLAGCITVAGRTVRLGWTRRSVTPR